MNTSTEVSPQVFSFYARRTDLWYVACSVFRNLMLLQDLFLYGAYPRLLFTYAQVAKSHFLFTLEFGVKRAIFYLLLKIVLSLY